MRLMIIQSLTLLAVLILTCTQSSANDSMQSFSEKFRAAAISSNTNALLTLVHAKSKHELSSLQRRAVLRRIEFFSYKKLTETLECKVQPLPKPQETPLLHEWEYFSVKPTHNLILLQDNVTLTYKAVLFDGRYYWVLPLLTAAGEQRFLETEARRHKKAAQRQEANKPLKATSQ